VINFVPFYLIALAGFLLYLNTRTYTQPIKTISYLLMWAAAIASLVSVWVLW